MKRRKLNVLCLAVCVLVLTGCTKVTQKGIDQLESKQYEQAAQTFGKVIKSGKSLDEAYHGQGIAYYELKKYDKAKESLQKALENGADQTATLYQILGDCNMQLGNYEEALTNYWDGMSGEGLTEKQLQEMSYNEVMAYEQLKDWKTAKVKMAAYVRKYPEDEKASKEAEFLETR